MSFIDIEVVLLLQFHFHQRIWRKKIKLLLGLVMHYSYKHIIRDQELPQSIELRFQLKTHQFHHLESHLERYPRKRCDT